MFDYKNVRVSVVTRTGDKDWAGTGRYLSIRAYRGRAKFGNAIFPGPDLPITSNMSDAEIERIAQLMLQALCGGDEDWQHEYDIKRDAA